MILNIIIMIFFCLKIVFKSIAVDIFVFKFKVYVFTFSSAEADLVLNLFLNFEKIWPSALDGSGQF